MAALGAVSAPAAASTEPTVRRPSFSVIVPALNEEDNLRAAVTAVLDELGPLASELEVLVFDDASTDGTGAVADALAAEDRRVVVIHNPRRLNIGGIYKAGVARARGDYVILVPGDNETRVDEIARALPALARADVIVFFITNTGVRPRARRALSRLYVLAVNALFGTTFRYTNGTNVFRTDVVRRLGLRTDGFSYQTEALVKAVGLGVDFVEVGVELQRRETGVSKALTWKNVKNVAAALARLYWDVRVVHRDRYRGRGRSRGVY
jgi:glycosyltransferase involved in cell wall biosynthesis